MYARLKLSLLLAISLTINSCTNSGITGKTFYLLSVNMISQNIAEYKLEFKSSDVVEVRNTVSYIKLTAKMRNYKNDPGIMNHSTLLHYSFKNGIFEIPERKLLLILKTQEDGSLKANTGEIFYCTSIVEANKEESNQRIEEAAKVAVNF